MFSVALRIVRFIAVAVYLNGLENNVDAVGGGKRDACIDFGLESGLGLEAELAQQVGHEDA